MVRAAPCNTGGVSELDFEKSCCCVMPLAISRKTPASSWEGTFFKAIQYEPILEATIQIMLQWTLEVHLWFGLIAQGKSFGVIGGHIARDFHRLDRLDLAVIEFLHRKYG